MRRIIEFSPASIRPSESSVAQALGIPRSTAPDERTRGLIVQAIDDFSALAEPVGLMMEIDRKTLQRVYIGEGMNETETPLDIIVPEAEGFAIYAVTVGEPVCRKISRLFETNDFAAGAVLDAAASEGAELAAEEIERQYASGLKTGVTMAFSPGYCGWHVSAQRKLFEILNPGEINITLTPGCLMEPLKSVSGVIISGPREIFDFEDAFPFCNACRDRSCRGRIAALAKK